MKINVEQCWNGGDSFSFRLTFNGRLEKVIAERWNRTVATQTKNLLERVYGLNRKNIRFEHR